MNTGKRKNRMIARFLVILLTAFLVTDILQSTTLFVYAEEEESEAPEAYDSWLQGEDVYEELYDGTTNVGTNTDWVNDISDWWNDGKFDSASWIINLGSLIFMFLGWLGDSVLSGGWGNLGKVNLSMDAVIFGRIKSGVNSNYVTFELVNNNIYGIIGATYYRFFANVCYSLFVIVFLVMLLRQLGGGDASKKRAELKDTITYSLLMFLFLYLFPHLADFLIYIRDWALVRVFELAGKSGDSGISGLASTYASMWWNLDDGGGGWMWSILYLGTVCASFFFVFDYVKIAIKQLVLFGLFPILSLLSIKNRRLLSNVLTEFVPNIFVPTIDALLLMLPLALGRIAVAMDLTAIDGGINYGIFLIQLIMIWNIIPIRKEILRLVGQSGGIGGSRGFGGIMAAAMMALRMFGGKGSGMQSGIADFGMSAKDSMNEAALNSEFASAIGQNALMPSTAGAGGSNGLNMDAIADQAGNISNEQLVSNLSELSEGATEMAGADGVGMGADAEFDESGFAIDDTGLPGTGVTDEAFYDNESAAMMRGENLAAKDEFENLLGTREPELREANNLLQSDIDELQSTNAYDQHLLTNYDNLVAEKNHVDSQLLNSSGLSDIQVADMSKESARLGSELSSVERRLSQSAKVATPIIDNPNGLSDTDIVRKGIDARNATIDEKRALISQNNGEVSKLRGNIAEAKMNEQYNAKVSEMVGSSGKQYANSAEYEARMKTREILRKYANYQNFDSKRFNDILTPEERVKLHKERAYRQQMASASKPLTAVTAIMGGAIGASAALYGGPSAMASGALAGGVAGGKGGKEVARRTIDNSAENIFGKEVEHKIMPSIAPRKASTVSPKKEMPAQNNEQLKREFERRAALGEQYAREHAEKKE